jgi:hypothetical protein
MSQTDTALILHFMWVSFDAGAVISCFAGISDISVLTVYVYINRYRFITGTINIDRGNAAYGSTVDNHLECSLFII